MTTFNLHSSRGNYRPLHSVREEDRASKYSRLAFLIAVCVHGIWVMAANRELRMMTGPAWESNVVLPTIVSFAGDPAVTGNSNPLTDIRVINSPILFSLPMSVGFSKPFFSGPEPQKASLASIADGIYTTPEARTFDLNPFGASSRNVMSMIQEPRTSYLLFDRENAVRLGPFSESWSGKLIAFWQDKPDHVMDVSSWLPVNGMEGLPAWDGVVYICTDEFNIISQVIVERPAPSREFNLHLSKMIRSELTTFPSRNSCGRLVLVYKPAIRR
ncbi:MAG TPA: hypothetical protein PJ991_01285 [Kiritimatiellia bacterium]|mgnify:CR=1 FL=1|nr:hypothetical protein [Kiritimatiellia bacterium]